MESEHSNTLNKSTYDYNEIHKLYALSPPMPVPSQASVHPRMPGLPQPACLLSSLGLHWTLLATVAG